MNSGSCSQISSSCNCPIVYVALINTADQERLHVHRDVNECLFQLSKLGFRLEVSDFIKYVCNSYCGLND